jgi:glycosyltransferase involved in cell wall biosynthesis
MLYLTADVINSPTGGGLVTYHENEAARLLGLETDGFQCLNDLQYRSPWEQDAFALDWMKRKNTKRERHKLAHFYSGSFPKTIAYLKSIGVKVCQTIAAHDKEISKREHELLGVPFAYPHLTDENLWKEYIKGYQLADKIVCPGKVPAEIVESYPIDPSKIVIIPHGCTMTEESIAPLPKRFTLGYLGSYGVDKGVAYLLAAWSKLAWKDAVLVLGGKDSQSDYVTRFIHRCGARNVVQLGWVEDPNAFYDNLTCYCQPSCTEGFGLEVLEAMARGRYVLCSGAAGACDLVPNLCKFSACSTDSLVATLSFIRSFERDQLGGCMEPTRDFAEHYTWDKIKAKYIKLWKSMLEEN